MKRVIAFAIALTAACSGFAKTFDWPLSAPVAEAKLWTAYHGETVRFNLVFSGAMSNVTAEAIYYQTNGMGKTDWFGPVPGTVFHPTNDCGAASYRFFVKCSDPDGRNYTPNGTLRLLDSPGFEPSAVQLPVRTLDFAAIDYSNAPWPAEIDRATNSLSASLSSQLSRASQAATNYTDSATNGLLRTEMDPTVGLTNGTIYVKGATITPLTSHQSLANYATKAEMDAATTLSPGYSPWEFKTDGSPSNSFLLRWEPTDDPEDDGGGWGWHLYLKNDGDPMLLSQTAKGTLQSTSLSWLESEIDIPSPFDVVTAMRTKVEGYFLGSDTEHPLADAVETDRRLAAKADASDLRYAFHDATVSSGTTPTVTGLVDRAINAATLGSTVTAATITLPAATSGKARDFFVNLTIEASTAPTLTFVDPATSTTADVQFGLDSLADITTGYNLILFTEIAPTKFLASVKHEEAQ